MMEQEPTVYSLIAVEPPSPAKPPRHTSKFKYAVKDEVTHGKAQYKTMGQAKVPVPTTDNFLKKHSKEPILPDKLTFQYECGQEAKRPAVPPRCDEPLMGLKTNKNFITTNACQNITSIPKKPEKKFADTRIGDTHRLEPSGLEPVFVHKKEYGKVPNYLEARNKEMVRAQEEYDRYVTEHFKRGAMRQLTEQERMSVLQGLKTNWEDIHEEYQGLSVVTDTPPKKNRKERMEHQMKQLERDIEIFEKHRFVYIAN
ncbi:enkurin-like [Gigantopelta aegis]|uniref:enkurin-like n=1 Tax=Gigantopelta aegis TaxID=1735272 RepID=UPI001B88941A|nr:enkurin-like [Gigantopelta aegis]